MKLNHFILTLIGAEAQCKLVVAVLTQERHKM